MGKKKPWEKREIKGTNKKELKGIEGQVFGLTAEDNRRREEGLSAYFNFMKVMIGRRGKVISSAFQTRTHTATSFT